jgi:hypothetical protein
VIFDATACPQDIAYPTDIGLLDRFREIVEAMIDDLHATHPQRKEVQKLSISSQKMLSRGYSKYKARSKRNLIPISVSQKKLQDN